MHFLFQIGFLLKLSLHLADLLLEGVVLASQEAEGAVDVLDNILTQIDGLCIDLTELRSNIIDLINLPLLFLFR